MPVTQSTILRLKYGNFTIAYHATNNGDCLSIHMGDLQQTPIVRFHSSCLFGEALHALDCECAAQLTSTLKLIKQNHSGVVIYSYAEGRGAGMETKIKAIELQRTQKINTVEAFRRLGLSPDVRTYEVEIAALRDLDVSQRIKAATQNPNKIAALQKAGFTVTEEISPPVRITKYNIDELRSKKELLGYHINTLLR